VTDLRTPLANGGAQPFVAPATKGCIVQITGSWAETVRAIRVRAIVAFLLAALSPAPLFACATCYGASDSPMAQGMNWGIFTLLGVILSVLACVVAFFVRVGRTSAKLQNSGRTQTQTEELP
jgi:hypothetical protein